MNRRFQQYVFGNPQARRTGDRTSLLISFVWFLACYLFGIPGGFLQSICILTLCQIGATVGYCLTGRSFPASNVCNLPTVEDDFYFQTERRLSIKALLAYSSAFAASALVAVLSGPSIEAAVLDDRLRRLSKNPSRETVSAASSLIASANASKLVLATSPIERIVKERLGFQDVAMAVVDRVNAEASRRGLVVPIYGMMIRLGQNGGRMFLNGISGESLAGKDIGVPNPPGSQAPPDLVAFGAPIGSEVTRPRLHGLGIITINGENGEITFDLEGLHCKNLVFSQCRVLYRGGPLILENCGFADATFSFAANLKCQELAERILTETSVDWISKFE